MGAFLSSYSMKMSAQKLIAYFDLQNTQDVSLFNTYYGKNPDWGKGTAYIVDMINHTLEVIVYFLVAAGLVYLPHQFIEFSYDPESVMLPKWE